MKLSILTNITLVGRGTLPLIYSFPVTPDDINFSNSVSEIDFSGINKNVVIKGNRNPTKISFSGFMPRSDDLDTGFIDSELTALAGAKVNTSIIEIMMGIFHGAETLKSFGYLKELQLKTSEVLLFVTDDAREGWSGKTTLPFNKVIRANISNFSYTARKNTRVEYSMELTEVIA